MHPPPKLLRRAFFLLLAALLLGGGSGCASARSSHATVGPPAAPQEIRNRPRHRPTTAQKLQPAFWFGNLDDPEPPEWYRRDDPARAGRWSRRNLLHNFTFYVIGIADREFVHTGRFPGQIFHPRRGWNWTVCRIGWLRLPLLSYKGRHLLCYIGWRERGNFGLKLNFRAPPKPRPARPAAKD